MALPPDRLGALLEEHAAAVDHFVGLAGAIPDSRWLTPRAEGKWTPAEETRHLILTYRAFTGDLRGQRKMALKGTPLRRFVWRLLGLPVILYARRIPRAVRAPREIRPDGEASSRDPLIDELRREVREFEGVFADQWRARPDATVTHPFFGELTLPQSIHLATVHTRHHAAFLPGSRPM